MPDTIAQQYPFRFDEEEFLRRVPHKLVKTNLPGTYAVPAPPDDFDPNTAAPIDLVRNGLMLRRPDAKTEPRLRAAWDKVFGRKWLARDRIVPHLVPRVGKTHLLREKPVKRADGSSTNSSWSGAAIGTGSWTTVLGYWHVPTVSQPGEPQGNEGGWNSSSWIGIDGYGTNDVLQAGVQQYVDPNGNAIYVAWFEWYAPPQDNSPGYIYQTNIQNFPVSPGDQVYCSAQYTNNNTTGSLNFANDTTGQTFQITLAPPPGANFSGTSIEWIMEAPDGGEPTSSLPRFTPVTFTTAVGCGPNFFLSPTGDPSVADTLNIADASGNLLTSVVNAQYTTTINFIG